MNHILDQEEVIAGNKLIAEFMGVKIGEDKYSWRPGVQQPLEEQHLAYHSSWGWIMPVVEKISRIEFERRFDEDLGKWIIWTYYPVTFGMLSEDGKPMVRFYCSSLHFGDTLIEAAWLAIVDFIKWYNSQTPLLKDKDNG
jgi:hypothetical protein